MPGDDKLIAPEDLESRLADAITVVKGLDGLRNVFFVACGGSFALMIPAQYMLQSTTGVVEAHALNSREFTSRDPKSLGSNSLVILCSHSGNTPETVEAARFARERGAATIAFTFLPGSPLDEAAEHAIYYQHGPDKTYAYTTAPLLYRLVGAVIDKCEATDSSQDMKAATAQLDPLVTSLHEEHFEAADAWGKKYSRSSVIYTLGSGPNYGVAYSFAICLLQEMMWVHSQAINSAEYFHGPFEITDFDVPFIELIGLGEPRPIDERSHRFVTSKSDEVLTIDAAAWDLSTIPERLRPFYAHLVFSPLLRLYAERLADHKGHPLTVRRYMWRMDY